MTAATATTITPELVAAILMGYPDLETWEQSRDLEKSLTQKFHRASYWKTLNNLRDMGFNPNQILKFRDILRDSHMSAFDKAMALLQARIETQKGCCPKDKSICYIDEKKPMGRFIGRIQMDDQDLTAEFDVHEFEQQVHRRILDFLNEMTSKELQPQPGID